MVKSFGSVVDTDPNPGSEKKIYGCGSRLNFDTIRMRIHIHAKSIQYQENIKNFILKKQQLYRISCFVSLNYLTHYPWRVAVSNFYV